MLKELLFLCPLCSTTFSLCAYDLDHVSMTVVDLQKSITFYKNVLSFTYTNSFTIDNNSDKKLLGINDLLLKVKVAQLKLGDEKIELIRFTSTAKTNQVRIDSKRNNLLFQHISIMVSSIDKAYKKLKNANVEYVSSSPQTIPADVKGKFRIGEHLINRMK